MKRHRSGHLEAYFAQPFNPAFHDGSPLAALRARKMRVFEERVSGIGRGLAVRLHTAGLFLAAGGSMTR